MPEYGGSTQTPKDLTDGTEIQSESNRNGIESSRNDNESSRDDMKSNRDDIGSSRDDIE